MAAAQKITIVCLVTRVCLTNAILTVKTDPVRATNIPRPWHTYLPPASAPFTKHQQYALHVDRAIENDPKKPVSSRDLYAERPKGLGSASSLNNHKQKLQTGPQRFPTEIQRDDVWLSTEVPTPTTMRKPTTATATATATTILSEPQSIRGSHRHVPRRFASPDVENFDRYLTDEIDDGKLPYPGKAEVSSFAYHRHAPQDITAVVKALDRFLSRTLNGDSHNTKLHPPPNPILSLILSRYGRYVPGTRNPRVYAYMAVNNIHNNKPFGRYKYECDEEPIYTLR